MKFKELHIRVSEDDYQKIKNIADKKGESVSEIVRQLTSDGLTLEIGNQNIDLIASVVRKSVAQELKQSVERLAAIGSKAGHMSATAAFLNVQALMDLVPKENRKNVPLLYEKARERAAHYMSSKTEDFKKENNGI